MLGSFLFLNALGAVVRAILVGTYRDPAWVESLYSTMLGSWVKSMVTFYSFSSSLILVLTFVFFLSFLVILDDD